MTMLRYDPADCYWQIWDPANPRNDDGQRFSSARFMWVNTSDAAYTAWLASGRLPSRVTSQAELIEVMQAQVQPLLVSQGVQTSLGKFAIDGDARDRLQRVALYCVANNRFPAGLGSLSIPRIDGGGLAAFATPAQFLAFATALEDYAVGFEQAVATLGALPAQPVNIVLPS